MGVSATITDTGTDGAAQAYTVQAGLTNTGTDPGSIHFGPGTFTFAYPFHLNDHVNLVLDDATILLAQSQFPPVVVGVPATVGGGLQPAHRITLTTAEQTCSSGSIVTWRTLGTAIGVCKGTPLDVGPKRVGGNEGGWGTNDALVVDWAVRLESGTWSPAIGGVGLFGITDAALVGSTFGAVATPFYAAVEQRGGVPAVVFYVRGSDGVERRFWFSLGASPPATQRGAFQLNLLTGTVVAARNSTTNVNERLYVAVTAQDGAWTPGMRLDHNHGAAACTVGGVGPSPVAAQFGERYPAADLTVIGLWMGSQPRWREDLAVGQQLQQIGAGSSVQAQPFPDGYEYQSGTTGVLGFLFPTPLPSTDKSPDARHFPVLTGGGVGNFCFGFWLRVPWGPNEVATSNKITGGVIRGTSSGSGYGVGVLYGGVEGEFTITGTKLEKGAYPIAKLGGPTGYLIVLRDTPIAGGLAASLQFGYGIVKLFNVNVDWRGARSALVLSQTTFTWEHGFLTDSDAATWMVRSHGAQAVHTFVSVQVDFEGGGPLGGHYYLNSAGSEFPANAKLDNCTGGSGRTGKPFIVLDGKSTGGLSGKMIFQGIDPEQAFVGDGEFRETHGGLWSFYEIPPGNPGAKGDKGDPGSPGIPVPGGHGLPGVHSWQRR